LSSSNGRSADQFSTITRLYRKVERLQQQINRMFTTGAGDEYLERVVRATETSATQAIQIKDSLVADLKQILSELTNQQVEASRNHSKLISIDVGAAVADSLRPPMEKITEAVTKVGANQGEAVTKLVMDVLTSFSGQMREMFGGQMAGVGELLQATNAAMQSTAAKFEQLAGNMDSIGKGAAEAMSERLTQAIVAMEARQQLLNQQMTEFVHQIRELVGQSQTEASQKLQETLATLGEQVSSVVAQLQLQVVAAANSHDEQVNRMSRETGAMMGSVSREVEHLIEQSARTNQALQATVSALASSTQDSIGRMNSGAEMLYAASSDFAKAGQGVNESIRLSNDAVSKMREVSQSLVGASNTTQQVSAEYARSRDVFAVMVSELKSTVENARREASMTSEVLANLREASEQLSAAEKQAEAYLAGISAVLAKAHEAFAGSIENTLRRGNADFQKHLGDAVSFLSSGIQDLGSALDQLAAKH
jgi:ABC-type transporter Mla subunit MlaD